MEEDEEEEYERAPRALPLSPALRSWYIVALTYMSNVWTRIVYGIFHITHDVLRHEGREEETQADPRRSRAGKTTACEARTCGGLERSWVCIFLPSALALWPGSRRTWERLGLHSRATRHLHLCVCMCVCVCVCSFNDYSTRPLSRARSLAVFRGQLLRRRHRGAGTRRGSLYTDCIIVSSPSRWIAGRELADRRTRRRTRIEHTLPVWIRYFY